MSRHTKIYVLVALVALLVAVYFFNRNDVPGVSAVVGADAKFTPLSVQEPQLRLDLLAKIRKLEYAGTHRNIFSAVALPPAPTAAEIARERHNRPMGPQLPPPPPPVQVPGQFFGYASSKTGRSVAFFTSGDDVLVVAEGDTFLNNFRLVHIGFDSADVEEISSGRHAQVPMVQPPASAGGPDPGAPPPQ
jgi:hypothetical protein